MFLFLIIEMLLGIVLFIGVRVVFFILKFWKFIIVFVNNFLFFLEIGMCLYSKLFFFNYKSVFLIFWGEIKYLNFLDFI